MGQIFLLFGTGAALGSGGGVSEVRLQKEQAPVREPEP
jgi:hypothetical protein